MGQLTRAFDQMAQALEHREVARQSADHALKASEMRYRRLFETAQDGILILNAVTGQIDDVNPFLTDLLGYSREQLLGNKLWDIGPFKDTKASKSVFRELQREAYVRYEDLPLETSAGKSIHVEFVSNVYRVNGGKVIQCNIRDITERRKAEAKRKEYNRKLQALSRRLVELYYWHQNVLVQHSETLKREYQMLLLDYPDGFVDVNTEDARRLEIRDGARVRLVGVTGVAVTTARVTNEVKAGMIFVPFFLREMREQLWGETASAARSRRVPVCVRLERV